MIRLLLLLSLLTALFIGIGFLIAGPQGMVIAGVIAAVMQIIAIWNSDTMVLKMYGARLADPWTNRETIQMLQRLSKNAGLPEPKFYIIDEPQPNAFATGRSPQNSAVAITTGLKNTLNSQELEGVIAHELAHIKNRDTLIMTLTATLAGAIGLLTQFAWIFGRGNRNGLGLIGTLLIIILAPIAAMLVQMAISRSREYKADQIGAAICGKPLALASALEKIAMETQVIHNDTAEDNPATAHLFIMNPLKGTAMDQLFSTHPSTTERIRRLRAMTNMNNQTIQRTTTQHTRGPWG